MVPRPVPRAPKAAATDPPPGAGDSYTASRTNPSKVLSLIRSPSDRHGCANSSAAKRSITRNPPHPDSGFDRVCRFPLYVADLLVLLQRRAMGTQDSRQGRALRELNSAAELSSQRPRQAVHSGAAIGSNSSIAGNHKYLSPPTAPRAAPTTRAT